VAMQAAYFHSENLPASTAWTASIARDLADEISDLGIFRIAALPSDVRMRLTDSNSFLIVQDVLRLAWDCLIPVKGAKLSVSANQEMRRPARTGSGVRPHKLIN
jgi:hypothetical protein